MLALECHTRLAEHAANTRQQARHVGLALAVGRLKLELHVAGLLHVLVQDGDAQLLAGGLDRP